ncbi:hypothetical protein TNCV_4956891 [Trichonephila clavipes]|nr:hypothetical protein TNCV_4956891 [Trichonephila clavipes]
MVANMIAKLPKGSPTQSTNFQKGRQYDHRHQNGREARESFEDVEHSGRPQTSRAGEEVSTVVCVPIYVRQESTLPRPDNNNGCASESLVYADKPQTLDHLEDNIRRVIADIRPQMLEKVIENWTSRLDYIRASRGSPMPEIIFKM